MTLQHEMKSKTTQIFILALYLCFIALSCSRRTDLSKSVPPDFTGFWKARCSDAFGVQIKKQNEEVYSVSFCGPGGCFEPGKWMPNTAIVGDPQYRTIEPTTLELKHGDFWQTLTKCTMDTNPVLDYSTSTELSSTRPPNTMSETQPDSESNKAEPAPTLPFFDWNACPFEGCTYGAWTTTAAVEVFDTWRPGRKRITTLPVKAAVTGISGLVITYKPGVIRLNADLPHDGLRRGDSILTYTYLGEGLSAVWFHGRFYREYDITFAKWPDGSGCLGEGCAGTYVDLGEKVWWARVRLSTGVVGWVNMNNAKFEGVDQFAFVAPDLPPFS